MSSLLSTSAFLAQAAPAPSLIESFGMVVPMILIMVVFWLFMIRPQQRKLKERQEQLSKVNRGDTIITNGGLIGKVVKVVDDKELLVDIGENVKVRILRQGIADIRAKGEPVKDAAVSN